MKAFAQIIENAWYQNHWWIRVLTPLMWLFIGLTALRRWLFQIGAKSVSKPNVPVIVVGNISVGGTGKTPLVIALCKTLIQAGYQPGVVSRGYGGRLPAPQVYPVLVQPNSAPEHVGDEPALMKQNLDCLIMVDPIRSRAAHALVEHHGCNVIVCDDGLQHYSLGRNVEVVVVDAERGFGNQQRLPVGPLREGVGRLRDVDFVVFNQQAGTPSTQQQGLEKQVTHLSDAGLHRMTLHANYAVNLVDRSVSRSLASFEQPVVALAGIGHPERFFTMLKSKGLKLTKTMAFADHHAFTVEDIPSSDQGNVLMTEKDAVKCREIAHKNCWYIPVTATLSDDFLRKVIEKIETKC